MRNVITLATARSEHTRGKLIDVRSLAVFVVAVWLATACSGGSKNVDAAMGDAAAVKDLFAPKVDFTTGTAPFAVAVGDLNGDGKTDIAVANNLSNSVSVLLNTSATNATTPSFAPKADFATGTQPVGVDIGDFNGDGKPDVVVANYTANSVSVFLNTTATGATTPSFAAKVDVTTGTRPNGVAIGDLNGDGKPDVAVANNMSDTVSVFLNTTATGATTPSFAARVDFTTGTQPIDVAIGDLNGDGKPDITVANNMSISVSVLLNTTATGATTPSFAAKIDFTTGTQPIRVAIGDLNGDSEPDLAVSNSGSNSVSVFLNTTAASATTPSFAAKVDFTTGALPLSVAIGDFNGDGKPDLAVANDTSNTVSVFLNTTAVSATTPSFSAKVDFTTGSNPRAVAIGDLNGDGKPDLAAANNAAGFGDTVSVLLAQ